MWREWTCQPTSVRWATWPAKKRAHLLRRRSRSSRQSALWMTRGANASTGVAHMCTAPAGVQFLAPTGMGHCECKTPEAALGPAQDAALGSGDRGYTHTLRAIQLPILVRTLPRKSVRLGEKSTNAQVNSAISKLMPVLCGSLRCKGIEYFAVKVG